jgi:hypothetical protein
MFYSVITSALCLASLATAHFSIEYPEWRGDSFATGASQYIYPCMTSRQSFLLNITNALRCQCQPDSIHKSDYLALDRWISQPRSPPSLTPQPLNETGNGTLCLPHILLPAGTSVVDGQNASIQVVTFGQTGSALYNVSSLCPSPNPCNGFPVSEDCWI